MYKIIGADGQPYGPVSVEQLRRWIAENRVRGDTLVQPEGAADQGWKPLSSFPELAADLMAAPPPAMATGSMPPVSSSVSSRASNKIPAGICGILLGGFGVHKFILGYTGTGGIMLAIGIGSLLLGIVTCGLLWPAYMAIHIIGLIEGIIYLTKTDEEFVRTYVDGRKEWF